MRKKTNLSFAVLTMVVGIIFSSTFVSAVYASGYVPPDGEVSTTWAHFESVDTHPYAGYTTQVQHMLQDVIPLQFNYMMDQTG